MENVELVPCSGDWVYQALNSFVLTLDGDFPGVDYLYAQSELGCDRQSNIYFYPALESWALGDRVILCVMER